MAYLGVHLKPPASTAGSGAGAEGENEGDDDSDSGTTSTHDASTVAHVYRKARSPPRRGSKGPVTAALAHRLRTDLSISMAAPSVLRDSGSAATLTDGYTPLLSGAMESPGHAIPLLRTPSDGGMSFSLHRSPSGGVFPSPLRRSPSDGLGFAGPGGLRRTPSDGAGSAGALRRTSSKASSSSQQRPPSLLSVLSVGVQEEEDVIVDGVVMSGPSRGLPLLARAMQHGLPLRRALVVRFGDSTTVDSSTQAAEEVYGAALAGEWEPGFGGPGSGAASSAAGGGASGAPSILHLGTPGASRAASVMPGSSQVSTRYPSPMPSGACSAPRVLSCVTCPRLCVSDTLLMREWGGEVVVAT
jgi:hypothetical protein